MSKEALFSSGSELLTLFCTSNSLPIPEIMVLTPDHPVILMQRYYTLIKSCAFYRPTTIYIAIPKCATYGLGGRAWSWPGYTVDRTPYGALQHELGHHIDQLRSASRLVEKEDLFSCRIYQQSKEKQLTGYLGTDNEPQTFYTEWFAEHFRLYVTNPDLSRCLAPRFFAAMHSAGFKPVVSGDWKHVLVTHGCTARILEQAAKKVGKAAKKVDQNPVLL